MSKLTHALSLVAVLGTACYVSGISAGIARLHESKYHITVTDKSFAGDKKTFLVFGKLDNGQSVALENSDRFWANKFKSAELQESIQVGKGYDISTYGWRILPYAFPNIISVQPDRLK